MSVVKDNFSMLAVKDNFNTTTVSKVKDNYSTVTIIFDEMIDVSKEVIAFTFFQMVAEVITSFKDYGRDPYDYHYQFNMIIIISIVVYYLLGWVQ